MIDIWGGDLNSLSYYDGGPSYCLETVASFEAAKVSLKEWHNANYAAWVQDENGKIVKLY